MRWSVSVSFWQADRDHVADQPGPERSRPGFEEAVLASFEFLQSYGLRLVKKDATFVCYVSRSKLL